MTTCLPAASRLRACCPRCARPASRCLCDLLVTVPHRTPVLLLQHPQELRQAKNSVGLLRHALQDCRWQVGEHFSAAELADWLHPPGRRSVLLYPQVATAPAAELLSPPLDEALQLVVIDATWRKSLKMLMAHPALAALPRLALSAPPPTQYRQIRAARRNDQISTLEATVHALGQLDGPTPAQQALLDAFEQFVARERARQPDRTAKIPAP